MNGCVSQSSIITHPLLLLLQSSNSTPPRNPTILSPTISSSSSSTRRSLLAKLALLAPAAAVSAAGLKPGLAALERYDPVTEAERKASSSVAQRINVAVGLLDRGRELQAKGDFVGALHYFTQVVTDYKDFAFSEYARVGRALALYEIGDRDEAIAEMEDVSISLKGYPEVHAALAAALYFDKHASLLAENQFTIATLLDPQYTDIAYVRETKHWPPSLVSSLFNFITLS
ncbi:unnamed protein product [Rhodiola kirilowii]